MKSLAKGVLTESRAPRLCWGQQECGDNRRINRYSQHSGKPELEINQWDSSRLTNGLQWFLPKTFFSLWSNNAHLHHTVIFSCSLTLYTKLEDWSNKLWIIDIFWFCFINNRPGGSCLGHQVSLTACHNSIVSSLFPISQKVWKSVRVGY